jgi:hypothetical protein
LTQTAEVRSNSSFESASDSRLHFGLGAAARVDSITVHWPSGRTDTLGPEPADQELAVQEGHGVLARHAGTVVGPANTGLSHHSADRGPR